MLIVKFISYTVYRVAQSVTLEDSTFPPEEFTLVQGLLTVQWDKIAPYPIAVVWQLNFSEVVEQCLCNNNKRTDIHKNVLAL